MTPAELKAARRRLALSQPGLARRLGVNVRTLAGWEIGERPVPRTAELAIAHLETEWNARGDPFK